MRFAAALLRPLHLLVLVAIITAWLAVAPGLWATLAAVATLPGGGRGIFVVTGTLLVAAWSTRSWQRHRPARPSAWWPSVSSLTGPDNRSPKQLEHLARHEAAHAVVAWNQGATVTSVDVRSTAHVGGSCSYQLPEQPVTDAAWSGLLIAMASVVEDTHTCQRSTGGCSTDVHQAMTHAATIIATGYHPHGYDGQLMLEDLLREATDRAAQIIHAHRHLVDAVAARLVSTPQRPWTTPDLDGLHSPAPVQGATT